MRIETVPLILGILIGVLGIGIIFDAWTPDSMTVATERRRRPRIERHRNGEALIGFGVLALAAAFIGRDSWRYSVLVVIIGAAFLLIGAVLNGRYVRELFVNRGPLRRRDDPTEVLVAKERAVEAVPPDEQERPSSQIGKQPRSGDFWDGVERRREPRLGERPTSRRDGTDPSSPR